MCMIFDSGHTSRVSLLYNSKSYTYPPPPPPPLIQGHRLVSPDHPGGEAVHTGEDQVCLPEQGILIRRALGTELRNRGRVRIRVGTIAVGLFQIRYPMHEVMR